MRPATRLAVLGCLLALVCTRGATTQADELTAVIDGLQRALATDDVDRFVTEFAPSLPAGDRAFLQRLADQSDSTVTLAERGRSNQGVDVEALIAGRDRAVLADWFLTIATDASGNIALASISEVSRIDELVRMEPDVNRPMAVTDLIVEGPHFSLSLPSGMALASTVDGRYTALALEGRATIRFAPDDPVEQRQLQIFSGRSYLDETVDAAFIRLSPNDTERVVGGTFAPLASASDRSIDRLRRMFEERVALDRRLELRHLSDTVWSLAARAGSLLVDFRTRSHGWLTYARSPNAEQDVSLFDRARRLQISLYASDGHGIDASATPDAGYHIEHTDLDVVVDPNRRWLRGYATIRFRPTQPTRTIALRLADTLRITSVTSDTVGPVSSLRSAGGGDLVIGWPHALDASQSETIDIAFQGVLPPQRLDEDAPASRRVLGLEDALGVEPRFLYSNATPWYPQAANPQFSTARLTVTVPEPFNVVATGIGSEPLHSPFNEPPGSPSGRQGRTATFTADRPIRYLAMLIARMNEVAHAPSDSADGTPAVTVLEGGGIGVLRRPAADHVQRILRFFSTAVGGSPVPEFTLVTLSDELPSGHSPAYFALVNQPVPTTPYVWNRDPVAFDDVPDFFLAHELAHQWFGQTIAGRDYRDQWISEGFAQYFAWLYVASVEGSETATRLMKRMRDTAESFSDEGPVRLGFRVGHLRGDRRAFRAINYNKAAVVLHQLRRLIGDEAFFAGLRELLTAHRFSAVSTADVERAFAAQTDIPLQRFFTRWIDEDRLPTLRFRWSTTPDAFSVEVDQVGDVFDVPFALTLELTDGRTTQVPLVLTRARERFTIPLEGTVRRVDTNDPLTLARVSR